MMRMSTPLSGNVARKINRETVVLLGWGRAILLQLAHPLVAAAVADYSRFDKSAGGYVRRVRQTVGGMLTITFGSTADARRAIERINHIHQYVQGVTRHDTGRFPAGTPYTATDPALLRWVHATLIDSMMLAYDELVGPLRPDERDAFCEEAAETARLLGVPDELVPTRAAELTRYLDEMYASGLLSVGSDARSLASGLLSPPLGPAAVPLFRLTRLVTVGFLPADLRDAYGFVWDRRRDRAFRAVVRGIRRMRVLLPARLRVWPGARAA
jgi:uncharacterized protein (DUF2236 family)